MRLEVLLGGLKNPQPAVRLDVVRVLGMLDETRALDALRQQYQAETEAGVRSALAWAGKRLYEAKQAGYATIDELCRYFGVDREVENTPDADEAELIQKLQDGLDVELRQMKQRAQKRQIGMAMAASLGAGMVGGSLVGMSAAVGAMSPGAGVASSNIGDRPQIGVKRTPATAPSTADISVWLRRLREGATPAMREQAAIELAQLNNPAALPHLAAVFVSDQSPKVRQAAQRFGKVLYWGAIYWEMEQDGSLEREMIRRGQALGKNIAKPGAQSAPGTLNASSSTPQGQPQTPASSSDEDVAAILRQAQQKRAARRRKRRR
ncbi:MAG: HEAT repeat domain-containing protein [Anaerolineae bacterium]|nr:HEAT repeat domain-containing protein [Anaerolineae bacterium]